MNSNQVVHPMVKLQQRVASLVNSRVIQADDHIAKIALLFGREWSFLKSELLAYGFSLQDPVKDLLVVETWDDEDN
jgi:hypothetical protein